jgi:hypothetical protein
MSTIAGRSFGLNNSCSCGIHEAQMTDGARNGARHLLGRRSGKSLEPETTLRPPNRCLADQEPQSGARAGSAAIGHEPQRV